MFVEIKFLACCWYCFVASQNRAFDIDIELSIFFWSFL
ncbi:hypothetical protein SynBIOSU31_02031 [Synechococcus sp. BIOS-U3-1]|nr:hypothetical protein SynBIOSU31_02031 [Synechococcus sp. BIOS-U3-1]